MSTSSIILLVALIIGAYFVFNETLYIKVRKALIKRNSLSKIEETHYSVFRKIAVYDLSIASARTICGFVAGLSWLFIIPLTTKLFENAWLNFGIGILLVWSSMGLPFLFLAIFENLFKRLNNKDRILYYESLTRFLEVIEKEPDFDKSPPMFDMRDDVRVLNFEHKIQDYIDHIIDKWLILLVSLPLLSFIISPFLLPNFEIYYPSIFGFYLSEGIRLPLTLFILYLMGLAGCIGGIILQHFIKEIASAISYKTYIFSKEIGHFFNPDGGWLKVIFIGIILVFAVDQLFDTTFATALLSR